MIAQEQFDFTHVPDEELYNPDRVFWQGKEAENAAWKAEMVRRKEARHNVVQNFLLCRWTTSMPNASSDSIVTFHHGPPH